MLLLKWHNLTCHDMTWSSALDVYSYTLYLKEARTMTSRHWLSAQTVHWLRVMNGFSWPGALGTLLQSRSPSKFLVSCERGQPVRLTFAQTLSLMLLRHIYTVVWQYHHHHHWDGAFCTGHCSCCQAEKKSQQHVSGLYTPRTLPVQTAAFRPPADWETASYPEL